MKASSIFESNSIDSSFELQRKRNFSFGVKKEQTFSKEDFFGKSLDKDLFGRLLKVSWNLNMMNFI
jgi:hypothetical protein